jgi:dolichol-phosphate mannosyltransferase
MRSDVGALAPASLPDDGTASAPRGAEHLAANGESGVSRRTERLAEVKILTPVSIIVPTYKEAENIPHLIGRLSALRESYGIDIEVLIMDDNSRDGTDEAVARLGHDWVKLVVRTENRGLSPSVVDGLKLGKHPVLVVMDADLSHPPEKIPDMILALDSGQQFVLGSRYVAGAQTDEAWGFLRWLNSRVATLLARPFSEAKDPMSGFFALRRTDFLKADYLNPIGYKIALELIVKCRLDNIGEVPIYFADRKLGQSKLTLKEQLRYVQHLRRLFIYKFGTWSRVLHFGAVGAFGTLVNLCVLTLLLRAGSSKDIAITGGIVVSVITNFFLNRRFTFSYAGDGSIVKQFLGFCAACSLGALITFAVTKGIVALWPALPLQIAACVGIFASMFANFVANRYVVFRETVEK